MKDKGFYGIGIEQGKTETNYWTLFRTAQILDADFVFVIGIRYKRGAPDTMKSYRHIPTYSYNDFDDFNSHRPFDCKLIGVEIIDNAIEVSTYAHPKRAIYLLGAEDNGLTNKAMNNCQEIIKLYGDRSMNVAVAGSIVLYDRYSKERK
jgi:tRNA G18 (ribose-2'-O)-methylase SpoU